MIMENSVTISLKKYNELIEKINSFENNTIKETIIYKSSLIGFHSKTYDFYSKEDINSGLLNEIKNLVKKIESLENKTFTQKLKDLFL